MRQEVIPIKTAKTATSTCNWIPDQATHSRIREQGLVPSLIWEGLPVWVHKAQDLLEVLAWTWALITPMWVQVLQANNYNFSSTTFLIWASHWVMLPSPTTTAAPPRILWPTWAKNRKGSRLADQHSSNNPPRRKRHHPTSTARRELPLAPIQFRYQSWCWMAMVMHKARTISNRQNSTLPQAFPELSIHFRCRRRISSRLVWGQVAKSPPTTERRHLWAQSSAVMHPDCSLTLQRDQVVKGWTWALTRTVRLQLLLK